MFLPIAAAVVLPLAVADLPGAWRAAHGRGTPGVFVVERQECHKGCSTYGSFRADDGRVRTGIHHAEAPRGLVRGDSIRAVLVGDDAYKPERSYTWLLIIVIGSACAAVVAIRVGTLVRRVRRGA